MLALFVLMLLIVELFMLMLLIVKLFDVMMPLFDAGVVHVVHIEAV